MSGPLNYTTSIKAEKTAAECLTILGKSGASAIAVTYTDKKPSGLAFRLDTQHGGKDFQLPVNVAGVHKRLMAAHKRGDIARGYSTSDQAERTAWRILKDWLEAQMAIIDAQMVSLDEVMLPYLQVDGSRTLYQAYLEREQLALEA